MIKHYTIALNLEIIATCIDDVKAIDRSEANCIELCEGMELDGITPEKGLIEAAVKLTDKPIRVMVRPRGGNFVYSDCEFEEMLATIDYLKMLAVEGIVIGMLTERHKIDERMAMVCQQAQGMKITFHRAFEQITDKSEAYEKLVALGIDSILSTTKSNILALPKEPITIRLGGGITDRKVQEYSEQGYSHFHLGSHVRKNQSFSEPIDTTLINKLYTL